MKVSVVIPTFNRITIFKECLNGILMQSFSQYDYEIVIVNDCSTDGTQSYCEGVVSKNSNVKYIRNEINQGRVKSRNNGILDSNGDIIIFLDNDMLPCKKFIEAHVQTHRTYANMHIAVLGDICYEKESLKISNFGRFIQSRAIGYRSRKDMEGIDVNNLNPKFFAGGNSSVRKEDLLKVGLFDIDFKQYGGEDEYLGYKLNQIGLVIVYNENACSIHYDNILPSDWKIKYTESGHYGLKVMVNKNSDYIFKTNLKYLLPIKNIIKNKSIKEMSIKIILRLLFTKFVVRILEIYTFKTDNFPKLYFPKLYNLLKAVWVFQGYKTNKIINYVQYQKCVKITIKK